MDMGSYWRFSSEYLPSVCALVMPIIAKKIAARRVRAVRAVAGVNCHPTLLQDVGHSVEGFVDTFEELVFVVLLVMMCSLLFLRGFGLTSSTTSRVLRSPDPIALASNLRVDSGVESFPFGIEVIAELLQERPRSSVSSMSSSSCGGTGIPSHDGIPAHFIASADSSGDPPGRRVTLTLLNCSSDSFLNGDEGVVVHPCRVLMLLP